MCGGLFVCLVLSMRSPRGEKNYTPVLLVPCNRFLRARMYAHDVLSAVFISALAFHLGSLVVDRKMCSQGRVY